jgi:hypothetical protein
MTLQIPYGKDKFTLTDNATPTANTFEPADGQVYLEDEKDIVETDILVSPFSGKRWPVLRENHREFNYVVIHITETQWEELEALRNADVTLTPHEDEPTITYDCLLFFLAFSYQKGSYYRDSAIIKLTEEDAL